MELKDNQTHITFHSGILTIGGTVIEIAYNDSRIFFDFGTEFKPELNLKDNSLQTLLEHRLVPHLNHLYHPELGYEETTENSFKHTAVFLSHCHLDHTRMVNYLDPKVPLYALQETKILIESLNANNDFLLPLDGHKNTRDIIGLENESSVQVGDIKITLYRVDHDAYGACGMIIETPDKKIAYTGDLRLHGFDEAATLKYCDVAKNCDVLMIEGVSISFEAGDRPENPVRTEQQLIDTINSLVEMNPGKQMTFNTYPGNVLRLAQLVKDAKRKVVCEASYAYILKQCLGMDVLYYNETPKDYGLNKDLEINKEVLLEDTCEYLWQVVGNHQLLKGGGVYIHSDATPLGDFDPAYQPFLDLLDSLNIQFERVACSGHAYPEDLKTIVDRIQPKLLVPIHSLHPEKLENKNGLRYLPVRGETI